MWIQYYLQFHILASMLCIKMIYSNRNWVLNEESKERSMQHLILLTIHLDKGLDSKAYSYNVKILHERV